LEEIFAKRGYKAADIDAIFYGNWLRFFGNALPE
jgi:membrane dipeptidase